MTMSMLKTVEPGTPSPAEQAAAQAAGRALARFAGHERVRIEVRDGEDNEAEALILPATAVRLLTDVLGHLAEGRGVTVMPEDAQLTTQQAATLLNVSRPYLVKLLDAGEIPYQMVGTHRRILLRDFHTYRQRHTNASVAALDALVAEAEELGMGY